MLENAQPRPRPRIFDKREIRREQESVQRSVMVQVGVRDAHGCRCCGRDKGDGVTLHHHHLTYRSRGGKWDTANICLLCAYCHALLHARQLWILGKDADRRLSFEVHEAAVVDLFGVKEVPRDVRIVTR